VWYPHPWQLGFGARGLYGTVCTALQCGQIMANNENTHIAFVPLLFVEIFESLLHHVTQRLSWLTALRVTVKAFIERFTGLDANKQVFLDPAAIDST
jgi:hypothetical protein